MVTTGKGESSAGSLWLRLSDPGEHLRHDAVAAGPVEPECVRRGERPCVPA